MAVLDVSNIILFFKLLILLLSTLKLVCAYFRQRKEKSLLETTQGKWYDYFGYLLNTENVLLFVGFLFHPRSTYHRKCAIQQEHYFSVFIINNGILSLLRTESEFNSEINGLFFVCVFVVLRIECRVKKL
jgi:hypothetical protein